jgi:hypothetical protein
LHPASNPASNARMKIEESVVVGIWEPFRMILELLGMDACNSHKIWL